MQNAHEQRVGIGNAMLDYLEPCDEQPNAGGRTPVSGAKASAANRPCAHLNEETLT